MDRGLMRWRAWYSDGSTFDSGQGAPWDTPPWGMIGICQYTQGKHEDVLFSGQPWYVYRGDLGYWMEHDDNGFLDVIVHFARVIPVVRSGRYMGREFFAIRRQAELLVQEWIHG